MSKDSSSLDAQEKAEKFPTGPTISSPGPMLLMQAARAVKVVTMSNCSRLKSRKEAVNTRRYTVRKRWTLRMCLSVRDFPSNRVVVTALGWSIFRMSPQEVLARITIRATLMPPPVDPAQAPMNMSTTRIPLEKVGQRLKSAVA